MALVAGEASGDLLGGLLLGGLRARWPTLQAFGIGGPCMAAQGMHAWWPHDRLSVTGYVEVLKRYRELVGIRNRLAQRLIHEPPQAFIGIDVPDFNLGLEARLKAAGIKAIHFVSPSIWAWRGGRIDAIARATDLMLCLFPFEPEIYARHGVRACYVGHPLADVIPMQVPRGPARAALGLSSSDRVVALMPGSRLGEVRFIGPRLLQAAARLHRTRPGLRFVLPLAGGMHAAVAPLLSSCCPQVDVQLLDGQSHTALAACDVVLVASGTATLEAALFKRPMVITYVMHWLNWQMMRRMNYLPWVGLPNILLRETVVPELLQDEATPQRLADAACAWLDDPGACEALQRRFEGLHELLRCDTASKATDAIEHLLAG